MNAPVARRANGILAEEYVRVAQPLISVGDPLLDALRRTGIAAFAVPAAGVDRLDLWVDAHAEDDARFVLAAVARHGGEPAAALALLTAGDAPPGAPGNSSGNSSGIGEDFPAAGEGADDRTGSTNPTPSLRAWVQPPPAGRPSDRTDRAGGHGGYRPERGHDKFRPELEPLASLSPTARWALAILALGVLALMLSGLLVGVFGAYDALLSLLGTAAVLIGVGMLVTRLRDGRRDDGQGNDGGPNGDGAVL